MNVTDGELYGSIAVASRVGISLRQLYHWVNGLHVVEPKLYQYGQRRFRRYTMRDVQTLREMRQYVDQGFTLTAAAQKVMGA